MVEKSVPAFKSCDDADAAGARDDTTASAEERLRVLLELRDLSSP
jgi:hypothetical protein